MGTRRAPQAAMAVPWPIPVYLGDLGPGQLPPFPHPPSRGCGSPISQRRHEVHQRGKRGIRWRLLFQYQDRCRRHVRGTRAAMLLQPGRVRQPLRASLKSPRTGEVQAPGDRTEEARPIQPRSCRAGSRWRNPRASRGLTVRDAAGLGRRGGCVQTDLFRRWGDGCGRVDVGAPLGPPGREGPSPGVLWEGKSSGWAVGLWRGVGQLGWVAARLMARVVGSVAASRGALERGSPHAGGWERCPGGGCWNRTQAGVWLGRTGAG